MGYYDPYITGEYPMPYKTQTTRVFLIAQVNQPLIFQAAPMIYLLRWKTLYFAPQKSMVG